MTARTAGGGHQVHGGADPTVDQAVLDHDATLARELDARVEHVLTAVRHRIDACSVRDALIAFLVGKLLPHAVERERTLYRAAVQDPRTELLVCAMIDDHRALADRVTRLAAATDPTTLATVAAEIRALFAVHTRQEHRYLLPALTAARHLPDP